MEFTAGINVDIGSHTNNTCFSGFLSIAKNVYLYINGKDYYNDKTNHEQGLSSLFYLYSIIDVWPNIKCGSENKTASEYLSLSLKSKSQLDQYISKKFNSQFQSSNQTVVNQTSNSTNYTISNTTLELIKQILTYFPYIDFIAIVPDFYTYIAKAKQLFSSSTDFEGGFALGKGLINFTVVGVIICLIIYDQEQQNPTRFFQLDFLEQYYLKYLQF
ncbi:UNKNOWN [Stylonychia lemnae]|uniref:Uncharacterized protein n=1 Tax=Stylonychia lemnae TaxID=5949 RepID=A0A078A053_STYLE|nr:UNKNOWN [Stylonychia lemnae]|eukprot:CDW74158.1 UNKNOWN [Stylonychia lemnae]